MTAGRADEVQVEGEVVLRRHHRSEHLLRDEQVVEYNGKVIKTESKMELTKKEIKVNSYKSTYSVKGNKLITSSGIEYEVFDNNKLRLLAGSGIEYRYEG